MSSEHFSLTLPPKHTLTEDVMEELRVLRIFIGDNCGPRAGAPLGCLACVGRT